MVCAAVLGRAWHSAGAEGVRGDTGGAEWAERAVRNGKAMCSVGQLFRLLSREEHPYTYPGRVARAFCGKTAARALAKRRE
ncbi:hypothetical protein HMPREF1650_08980 [Corynebacterium freneyi DNF00450]|uniref:Uncharacterized protein n=1 Tax=Corynebacterium freneyi DNF00450 TaxID=1287475 RepID=A0A096A5Q2_9CORY|nr:hypothetical protein HMPREF1650_08980 [Corynebacterium freneyi DNF00450]